MVYIVHWSGFDGGIAEACSKGIWLAASCLLPDEVHAQLWHIYSPMAESCRTAMCLTAGLMLPEGGWKWMQGDIFCAAHDMHYD